MQEKKQHVIKKAHELFITNGFQETSIQEILDNSGISKGTFYNYFSSKNELFIDLLKSIAKQIENDRNELLLGQDPADLNVFMKQIELQLKTNYRAKLIPLYEEVIMSNDKELKKFLQKNAIYTLRWYYLRFIDLFGKEKEAILLDCAIMFMGILQQNMRFYTKLHKADLGMYELVRYSVSRLVKMVEEVWDSNDQLIDPAHFESLFAPVKTKEDSDKITKSITHIKNVLSSHEEKEKYLQILDFLEDELLYRKEPRKFLLTSALKPLEEEFPNTKKLHFLREVIESL